MQIILNDVSYSYPGSTQTVLDGVHAVFPAGWTGIIGNNGCGKSTLARIATGMLALIAVRYLRVAWSCVLRAGCDHSSRPARGFCVLVGAGRRAPARRFGYRR